MKALKFSGLPANGHTILEDGHTQVNPGDVIPPDKFSDAARAARLASKLAVEVDIPDPPKPVKTEGDK